MIYRVAVAADYMQIAKLHTLSWQQNYRDDFTDDFLDNKAETERLEVWKLRLNNLQPNQYVVVVETDNNIHGFICIFLNKDPFYGSYIDNLHVVKEYVGQGIGTKLFTMAVQKSQLHYPKSKLYLWVLLNNKKALKYYKNLGGKLMETVMRSEIGDSIFNAHRIVWETPEQLMDNL